MGINLDKPERWKADIAASVDLFNKWFMRFAPKAYRNTRVKTTKDVGATLTKTDDLAEITAGLLQANPTILPTLRMSTCPPIARDRLIGLAGANKNLVLVMEEGLKTNPDLHLPPRMKPPELLANLTRIAKTITKLLDADIFPWLARDDPSSAEERYRASTIVADRLCGAVADPIIRNAQEKRQLASIGKYLKQRGYKNKPHPTSQAVHNMEPGTYSFRMNVVVGKKEHKVNIPVDCVIQPKRLRKTQLPILIEAKSAGDFTNVNKRRKEEATKMRQLREEYGDEVEFILFLCGYFDSGYLGYEAAEGIDWIWEHRISDMDELGL